MIFRLLPVLALIMPAGVMARDTIPQSQCTTQENVTLSIGFNGTSQTVKEVRGEFNERMEKVKQFAKKAGVEKISLQSQSYNINSISNSYTNGGLASGYQYNSSASYQLSPAEKAADLMELLTASGIQSTLNVNMYKSGSCQ